MKKFTDLGSAMKCKIIIHVFVTPISQRVGALGTEFETYKILQVLNFRTGNKSRNPNILSGFTGKTWDLKRFGNMPLPEAHATD